MTTARHAACLRKGNTFHGWILRNLPGRRWAAVDVGCGMGVLAGKLAPYFARVTWIDADASMAAAASFEPRHGEVPASRHVVRKPSHMGRQAVREPARRDLSTLRARLTAIPARPAAPTYN
jgi:SAM-dependent methyltransferase